MSHLVAVTRSGDLCILTPLIQEADYVDRAIDSAFGWKIVALSKKPKPVAYILTAKNYCQTFGPHILKIVEVIGEL